MTRIVRNIKSMAEFESIANNSQKHSVRLTFSDMPKEQMIFEKTRLAIKWGAIQYLNQFILTTDMVEQLWQHYNPDYEAKAYLRKHYEV